MSQQELSVISWNVLAQAYSHYLEHSLLQTDSERYEYVARYLQSWSPDVVLLQEVDRKCLSILQSQLQQYRFFHSQRPNGKPDGLAIAVLSHLDVYTSQTRYFRKADGSPSTRLGQQIILEFDQSRILIGNVHFSYDDAPSNSHVGLFESKQFLAGLPLRMVRGAVLAGDWNAQQTDEMIQSALRYGLIDAHPEKKPTCRANGRAMAVDHMLYSGHLKATVWSLLSFEEGQTYPNKQIPSDHLPIGAMFRWAKSKHTV